MRDRMKVDWVLEVDQSPPIVKPEDAQHHAQLLATFFMDNPLHFYSRKRNEIVGHIIRSSIK